jgi:hypothetical protein
MRGVSGTKLLGLERDCRGIEDGALPNTQLEILRQQSQSRRALFGLDFFSKNPQSECVFHFDLMQPSERQWFLLTIHP